MPSKKVPTNLVLLPLRITPNSHPPPRITAITSSSPVPQISVSVPAPAHNDRANAAVVDYICSLLRCPKTSARIIRGAKARKKVLGIEGIAEGVVWERLKAEMEAGG